MKTFYFYFEDNCWVYTKNYIHDALYIVSGKNADDILNKFTQLNPKP